MTEAELLDRISSKELTRWFALFAVEADERKEAQDRAESGDGEVHDPRRDEEYGTDDDGDDEPAE